MAGSTVFTTRDSCDIWHRIVCALLWFNSFGLCHHLCISEMRSETQYELFSSNADFRKWMFVLAIVWTEPAVSSLLPQLAHFTWITLRCVVNWSSSCNIWFGFNLTLNCLRSELSLNLFNQTHKFNHRNSWKIDPLSIFSLDKQSL